VFGDFLRGGGTIVTLTGNHDKENFCQTLRHAMSLAAPMGEAPGTVVPTGRLYLATEPTLVRLEDRATGVPVQFLLMPYPTPSRYLHDPDAQKYQGLDEKNRWLMKAFTEKLHALHADPGFSDELPAVLSAHITVRGSELPTLFRLSEQEDMVFTDADFPPGFHYVALGHIHKPQAIGGQEHIRYSGSIEAMDLGEKDDRKGVVLFDLGPEGLSAQPWTLPLESTPIYEIDIRDPQVELPAIREKYANAKTHLVRLRCTYTAGVDNREEVLRELEQIFPRWYDRQITESSALGPTLATAGGSRAKTFEETVREYLQQELINHDDEVRKVVLDKVEILIREVQS
jgi:exonuclease SbcD